MSYCASIQWATEILPTSFRASGSSVLHMTGYVATAVSPFIIYSVRNIKEFYCINIGNCKRALIIPWVAKSSLRKQTTPALQRERKFNENPIQTVK